MMIQSIVDPLISPNVMMKCLVFLTSFAYVFILNIKSINLYLWVNAVNEGTFEF